ncbi:MAG: InlB B-repeat-containing protein, partial [Bacteroidales bacterium]|nr:InlB B-repeat-containing protein [Bacteroidales bacterium]
VNVLIHNDNRTIDPGFERSQIVAQAKINPSATDGWQRFSAPFIKTGATNDAQYVLASFTTNKTPGGGNNNDELLIDDIFFVYNPTLRLNNFNTTAIGLRDGENVTLEVPFRITGTMSPQMGDDNIVIAELSDATGSFDHATEIGRLTTDESGSVTASLPPTLPVGNGYRIRVRSTNYPRVSEDNGKDIELFRGYYIEGKASAPSRGTVSGSQTYKQGTQATLTAAATPGNHFSHWSENGNRIEGADATYTFTVTRNRTLTAHFDTNYYDFKLQTEGEGEVSVSPQTADGRFVHNTPIRLTALPAYGSRFVGFYDGTTLLDNAADYTFPIVRDLQLTARFDLQQFNLTVTTNNTALGRVEGSGTYKFQSAATLQASPNPYCRFIAWINADGDTLSKDNPFVYNVTAAARITGVFAETFYRVATVASPATGGNAEGGGAYSAQTPQKIELTAEPKAGYTFSHWTIERGDGQKTDDNTDNPMTLVSGRISTDYTCTAVFKPIVFRIAAMAEPEQGGHVEGEGDYVFQSSVQLKAVAAEGYIFEEWLDATTSQSLSKQPVYPFQATADRQLTAIFTRERYEITATAEPAGFGSADGGGSYAYGDEARLNAHAAEGYEFRYWYRGGHLSDTAGLTAALTVPVSAGQTYTAVFTLKRKLAAAAAVPAQGGAITGTGLYEHGATAGLQAVAADGYTFDGWRDAAGKLLGSADVLSLKMDEDRTVQAVFTPRSYKVILAVAGNRKEGQVSFDNMTFGTTVEAKLPYDSTLTLYAQATADGYKVTDWYRQGGSGSLGKTEQIRYTVKENNVRIEVDFNTDLATVSVGIEPEGAGTVSNTGNHPVGQHIPLEAVAANGFQLARWEDETGRIIGTTPTYTVENLTDDTRLKAVFGKRTYRLTIAESRPAAAGQAEIQPAAGGQAPAGAVTLMHGDGFRLSARPAAGYRFVGWQTADPEEWLGTEPTYEDVATHDMAYRAVFAPLPYDLTTRTATAHKGRTRGDGQYEFGTQATVTALPTEGNHFTEWRLSVDGSTETTTATANPYTFTVAGETTAEAVFDTNTYTIRLVNRNPDLGTVTMTAGGTTQNAGGTVTSVHNGQTTFAASVRDAAHYRFAHFADAAGRKISTSNPWTLTTTSDTTVYAVFEPVLFAFSAESADAGMGAVSYTGGLEQPYLGKVTVTAEPFYGHEFLQWVLAD